jgi:PAT family beta-lactamase induction signal transducer AmpG
MSNTEGQSVISANSHKAPHPIAFLILVLPFGIMSGYLTVTLAYLFSKAGISIEKIAILVAISYIPQFLKFIWAPLVDVTLSVKKWYVLSTVVSAACLLATGIVPVKASSLPLLTIIIVASNFAVSFVAMAGNSLAAHDTPENMKGRVSGYMQAGNMGGSGVGGGAGLWLAQRMPAVWMAGGVLALTCIACCAALFFVNEPISTVRVKGIGKTINNVLQDVWLTIKAKLGILAFILCLMPIGTCAAMNLFSAVAKDWKTSADVVALVTGVVGGLITGVGSLIGGWVCDKMDRKLAYLLIGLLQAASAVGMAFFPHTQLMYIIWTLIYSVTAGLAYAAYNAFTLEAIGKGAAATKFELYASISNLPIYLMTMVAGAAYARWGANGMLNTEAVCACVAVVLFIAIKALIDRRKVVGVDMVPQT